MTLNDRRNAPRCTCAALAVLALCGSSLTARPVAAATDLDHPAAATAPADALRPAAPPPAADPLALDPVELWMATYHLDPTPERIPSMIMSLAGRGGFAAADPRARELLRFFAAALAADPAALALLQQTAGSAAGQEQALALAIAAKAGHYAPAVPETPEDLALLWAEYRATGKRESLATLAGLLGREDDPRGLAAAAAASLLQQTPRHAGARELLNEILRGSPESLQARLGPIVAKVNEWSDFAEVLNQRGENYVKAKQTQEALKAYRAAMEIYPSLDEPYYNLADVHLDAEDEANYPAALAALQIAVALDPDDAGNLALLGRAHFRMKRYDEAVRWLTRARECNPRYAYPVHLLGRVALRRNDTAAAIDYFKAYLALDPDGSRLSSKERGVLAKAGVTIVQPALPALQTMLLEDRYELLEVQFAALIRNRERLASGGSAVIDAYRTLADLPGPTRSSAEWVKHFETWVERQPSSHVAHAALGSVLVGYAWEARGRGWASTVLDERGKLFTERLLMARHHLEKAFELDPADPAVPTALITTARGLGLGLEETEKQFQRAIAADGALLEPYTEKLQRLLPKWGGSVEETLAFARAAAAAAPAGSAVPMVLPNAHRELAWHLENTEHDPGYYRRPGVWDELRPVFERHLGTFPGALYTRNWYAWTAYRAGDFAIALRELETIAEGWDAKVWGGFRGLKKARKEMAAAR